MGERSFLPSSSPASQDETTLSTPATHLTASVRQNGASKAPDSDSKLASAMSGLSVKTTASRSEDPFLDPTSAGVQGSKVSGLSPVATSFVPGAIPSPALTVVPRQESIAQYRTNNVAPTIGGLPTASTVRNGSFTSDASEPKRALLVKSQFSVVERAKRLIKDIGIHEATFRIVYPGMVPDQRDAPAQFVISFDIPNLAEMACRALRLNLDRASVYFYTPKAVARFCGLDDSTVSNHDGELAVTVLWDEINKPMRDQDIRERVKAALSTWFGVIKTIDVLPSYQVRRRELRVEFLNIRARDYALESGIIRQDDLELRIQPFEPDLAYNAASTSPGSSSRYSGPSLATSGQVSLTGRSILPANAPAFGTPSFDPLAHEFDGRPGRHVRADNRVDVFAIENGEDCRTTVMLRNIPNRVDCHQLKSMLDTTSFGNYDFAYLRIDFANNCNVGYAFINFRDAQSIVPFARARQGRRWTMFHSDKVAEISYATIQDRVNLIQKFRNSSVLLEHPDYRPKLFFVHPDARAGTEEPFPVPDNLQKMRRSVENAETVGLFHPSKASKPPRGHRSRYPTVQLSAPRPPHGRRRGHYAAPARATAMHIPHVVPARSRAPIYTPPPTPDAQYPGSGNVAVDTDDDVFASTSAMRRARQDGRAYYPFRRSYKDKLIEKSNAVVDLSSIEALQVQSLSFNVALTFLEACTSLWHTSPSTPHFLLCTGSIEALGIATGFGIRHSGTC